MPVILDTWKADIKRKAVPVRSSKKTCKTSSQRTETGQVASVIKGMARRAEYEAAGPTDLGKKGDLISKLTMGTMVQVIECLPSK
jgi:hypothetical protein